MILKIKDHVRLAEVSVLGLLLALIIICGGGLYYGGLALACGVVAMFLLRKETLWPAFVFVLMQYASVILNALPRMGVQ